LPGTDFLLDQFGKVLDLCLTPDIQNIAQIAAFFVSRYRIEKSAFKWMVSIEFSTFNENRA